MIVGLRIVCCHWTKFADAQTEGEEPESRYVRLVLVVLAILMS
jgi:hypothetical protein